VRKDDTSKTLIPLRIQKEKRNHGMTNERNEDIRMRIRCLTGREPARKRKKKKTMDFLTRRDERKGKKPKCKQLSTRRQDTEPAIDYDYEAPVYPVEFWLWIAWIHAA
jgi:hypothetical protein